MSNSTNILSLFDVSREQVFTSPTHTILLVDGKKPCGEIYWKDNHFGVRFGDYSYSPRTKELS